MFLVIDENMRLCLYIQASLHFYDMIILVKKERSLHRNGMTAIPKRKPVWFGLIKQQRKYSIKTMGAAF